MKQSYSDHIQNKRIVIIGRYPPPLGGISVHIERVITKLKLQHNKVFFFEATQAVRFRFFRLYQLILLSFLLWRRPNIVYYHTLYLHRSLDELASIVLIKKIVPYEIVIVDHNCRYIYEQGAQFKQKLNRLMVSIDQQVFIGNKTEESYRINDVIRPHNWSIECAFLPPDLKQEQAIVTTYPAQLFEFIKAHKPLLMINAFKLSLLPNNKDLYGFDLCLDVLHKLHILYPEIGLICALPQIGNALYFAQLQQIIVERQLNKAIYFLQGQKELWPLFKKVDLFLRPTLSDGDSISVREALYFGIPVIASDVCIRPEGVRLFKTGNADNCLEQIIGVLSRHEKSNISNHYLYPKSPR